MKSSLRGENCSVISQTHTLCAMYTAVNFPKPDIFFNRASIISVLCVIQPQQAGTFYFYAPTYSRSLPVSGNIPSGGRGERVAPCPLEGHWDRGRWSRRLPRRKLLSGGLCKRSSSISFILKRTEGSGDGVCRLQIKHSPLHPSGRTVHTNKLSLASAVPGHTFANVGFTLKH